MNKNKNIKNPFKWKHFTGEIILWLVRWYCRYALTYADLKEMSQEKRITSGEIDYNAMGT